MVQVVVIGGANIDIKAKATGQHHLATSNPGVVSTTPGGVARNIAHNLARLGNDVTLISAVGEDAFGDTVLAATQKAGVNISNVSRSALAPTGTYIALLDETGNLVSAVSDMRVIDTLTPDSVNQHAAVFNAARLIVVDCNVHVPTLIWLAERYADKLVVDPVSIEKSQKLSALSSSVFLATPNLDQADALFGTRDTDRIRTLANGRFHHLVLHAGPAGAFAINSHVTHIQPIPSATLVDVTGAGDAATAGLIHGLLRGMSLTEAAALGQQTAARVIASAKSTLE